MTDDHPKQRKIEFKPRVKLNYNIYVMVNFKHDEYVKISFFFFSHRAQTTPQIVHNVSQILVNLQ